MAGAWLISCYNTEGAVVASSISSPAESSQAARVLSAAGHSMCTFVEAKYCHAARLVQIRVSCVVQC